MAQGGGASALASAAMSAGAGNILYAAASVAAAPATSAGTGVAVAGVAGAASAGLWWIVAAVCPPVLTAGVAAVWYAYWTNLVSTQAAVKIQCKYRQNQAFRMRQHLQKENDEMATTAFQSQRRYVMLSDRPLREGGFSSVCLIRDVRMRGMATDAFRAAKVITCTSLLSKRLLLGYSGQLGELRFHRSFDHPQIPKLLDVFIGTSKIMMVMEFCPGGDLYLTLRRQFKAFKRGLLEDAAKQVMFQVGLAVTCLHSRHVAHRDIKSANVFISRQRARCL